MGTQRERTASGYVARCDPAQGGIRSSFVNSDRAVFGILVKSTYIWNPSIWLGPIFPDHDCERDERRLNRFRSFGRAVAVSPEIGSSNIIQRMKIIRNSRTSFRGNRRDLRTFMHRVGGCVRTYVGGSRSRGSEEEATISKKGDDLRVQLEIFFFQSISQFYFRFSFWRICITNYMCVSRDRYNRYKLIDGS